MLCLFGAAHCFVSEGDEQKAKASWLQSDWLQDVLQCSTLLAVYDSLQLQQGIVTRAKRRVWLRGNWLRDVLQCSTLFAVFFRGGIIGHRRRYRRLFGSFSVDVVGV